MKYIKICLFLFILCACNPAPKETEEITITNGYGQSSTIERINVEELSSFNKTAIILLSAVSLFTYKKYKISTSITEHFSHFHFSWLSLGMLITAVFLAIAEGTDPFYETMFATIGIILNLYYLYNQYHEAEEKQLTIKRILTCIILAILDILLLFFLTKVTALIIILVQILFFMIFEPKSFKTITNQ